MPLAALWWAHAPIALWFTLIVAASQVFGWRALGPGWGPVDRALLGVALFALLVQYPFVSVAEVQTPGHPSTVVGALARPEQIAENIRGVFPAALLPLSDRAGALGDLQLGYGLWAVLLCSAAVALTRPGRELRVLLVGAGFLLFLLLPIPGLNAFLWAHMPAEVVRITYYWPMQRFYLIAAALLAAAGQLAFGRLPAFPGMARTVWVRVLVAGCAWSLWESRQFIRAAADRDGVGGRLREEPEAGESFPHQRLVRALRKPAALLLKRGRLPALPGAPALASHGRMLPEPEHRILESGPLVGAVDQNPGVLRMGTTLHIERGRRYSLEFGFKGPNSRGSSRSWELDVPGVHPAVLRRGAGLRSRALERPRNSPMDERPGGDESRSGSSRRPPGRRRRTTRASAPTGCSGSSPAWSRSWSESLLPFSARVRAEAPVLLETPRMYMPGYEATVDGGRALVQRSEAGLASVAVPAGVHTATLSFVAPAALRYSYWAAMAGWAAIAGLAAWAGVRAVAAPRS